MNSGRQRFDKNAFMKQGIKQGAESFRMGNVKKGLEAEQL